MPRDSHRTFSTRDDGDLMPAHLHSDVRIDTRSEGAELELTIQSREIGKWLIRRLQTSDDGAVTLVLTRTGTRAADPTPR